MSSTEDVEADGFQPGQQIGAGGSSEDVLHGSDAHGAEAAQLSVQTSAESPGSSSGTAQQDTSSVRSFEFDAVLVFANAEKDEKLADEIERKMNGMKLRDGENAPCARVCQYDHARFGGSIVGRPHKLVEECRFVFIVLTENTQSDDILKFTKDEAIGFALSKRKQCVRYLHTQPEGQRTYVVPEGLDDVIPLIWYEPLQRCQKKIIELFRYHRENPLETASHQHDQKPFTGGSLRRLCSRSENGDVKGHNTEQQAPVQQMSPDLMRITNDSNRMLERWQKELFCQTIAASEAKKTLKLKGCVFITGRSGDGKTALVYHILTDLKKEKTSFQPYIIAEPEDMKYIPRKNSVVFVDNIFGASHFSSILLEKWRVWFQCIEAYVDAGDMYFIASSPCHVKDECDSQLGNIRVLSYVIDMVGEHSLRIYERENMLTEFLDRGDVKMSADEKQKAINSSFTLGFPQCCQFFVMSREAQALGADFFQNPYPFLNQQISKLMSSETENDRLAYMVLVECIFEKGKFSSETLNPFSESPTSLENLRQACGIQQSTTLNEIRDVAEKLCKMGYLRFNEKEGSYEFTHQSIYDAVCVSFGKKYAPKILELCSLKFLLANTTMSVGGSEKHDNIVQILPVHKHVLVKRILKELRNGNFRILEHSLYTSKDLRNELTKFKESFNEILTNPSLVLKFALSGMMRFLTASKKYTSLISYVVNTIRRIPEGKGQEIQRDMLYKCFEEHDGEMISIDSHVFDNILECKDTTDVHRVLLHQCLEGSCSAGDIIIFDKVIKLKNIKPCEDCLQKAIENPADQPEILIKLLTSATLGYISELDVVEALVKMKKVESLRRVLKSMKWNLSPPPGKQLELFSVACSSGNFEMFCLLQEVAALPDCKDKLLFEAVAGGSRQILESLVTEENINCVDQLGRTLLHHACLMKRSELCEFLIQKGVDHSSLDKNGMSALHLAIRYMDKESVEKLIKCGLQVTMGGLHAQSELQRKFSLLHMAAMNDRGPKLVEILIREGPRDTDLINFQDYNGMTPLHVAAQRPYGKVMMEELMKYKADHTLRDNKGKTALHIAAEENLPNNIQFLLQHNAEVNVVDRKGKTPLHYVLARRISAENMQAQMDSVNHLVTKGAAVSLADEDGNTCIHMAAKFSTPPKTFEKVLEKAGSHIGTNKEGMSPLHLLFQPSANLECMKMMIWKYPSLLQTKTDKPVLRIALERRSPYSIVETILDELPCAAETVNWDDIKFPQALWYYESEDVVRFLQRCSSYFPSSVKFALSWLLCEMTVVFQTDGLLTDEMWTDGMDSLELEDSFFAEERHQSLIHKVLLSPARMSYLISKGASVNIGDEEGNTPLHIAAAQGSVEGMKTLLGADADVRKSNHNNDSVWHVVFKCKVAKHHLFLNSNLRSLVHEHVFQKVLQMEQSLFFNPGHYFFRYDNRSHPIKDIMCVLLDFKVPLNVTNSQGFTPLHYSVDDKEVLDQLVSAGGDLKHRTEDGWSCLHTACMMKDNKEVVNYILDKDISPCVRDVNGIAPLHVALCKGMKDFETLKRLSHCSQDKTACHCEEQWPFLHVAIACCMKEIVEMLIEQTPDMLFKEDKEGTLPIHHAVAGGDLEIVKLVTEAMKTAKNGGAKTNDGDTVLVDESHLTESDGEKSGLELEHFDKSKGDVSHFTDQDPSPEVNESTDHKQQNLQQFLKPWERDYHDNTLLHIATRYSTLEVVNFLLKEGFVLNEFDTDGNTPLHYATAYSGSDVVDYLLKAGAKADCVNKEGLTPLLYALKMTHEIKQEAILTLVQHVPEVSVRTFSKMKENALHLLCKISVCGYLKTRQSKPLVFSDPQTSIMMRLVTMLIDKGCDVNARDEDGQTPLHLAAAAGSAVFVDILLDHGAEIDAVDNQGRTPLHRAVEQKNIYTGYAAVSCLVERGANPHAVVRSGPIVLDTLMSIKKPLFFQINRFKMILKKLNIMKEWKKAMTLHVKNRRDQLDKFSGLLFEDLILKHAIKY